MILRAEHLVKTYSRKVVDNVSIEVNQGEIVGLLGTKWCRKNNYILYYSWFGNTRSR
jgi:ABC-type lipopolysaccharide export system ATPase subunit